MKLDYIYKKNYSLKKYLHKLDVLKEVINLLPQLPKVEKNLRRKSLLKSSLFSARIEGNQLELTDIQYGEKNKSKNVAKIEIFNILKALRWIYSKKAPKKLTTVLILKLHKLVMADLTPDRGRFRKEASAIFNQAGVAVYLPPPPTQIILLMKKYVGKVNLAKDPGPVKAAIYHYAFEKIHPFLDGNGRVGRLISTLILKNSGYSFRGLVSLEEYFENHRQTYYDLLAENKKDLTSFVEFFLKGLATQAEKMVESLKNIREELPEDRLLPRRQEILSIVRDHKMATFDFIKRRFAKIPESTLHYDLRKLIEGGFIKKLGTTRGVFYSSGRL